MMDGAKAAGFDIQLDYVGIADVEEALDRVRRRVAQGGHSVPEADVRRRFEASLANLPEAIAKADRTTVYVNSIVGKSHRLVAKLSHVAYQFAEDPPAWATVAAYDAAALAHEAAVTIAEANRWMIRALEAAEAGGVDADTIARIRKEGLKQDLGQTLAARREPDCDDGRQP